MKGCLYTKRDCKDCTPIRFWVTPKDEIPQYDFEVQKTPSGRPPPPPPPLVGSISRARGRAKPRQRNARRPCARNRLQGASLQGRVSGQGRSVAEGDEQRIRLRRGSLRQGQENGHQGRSEKGWFNLACYGAAPAKMHLLRHTSAGSNPPGGPPLTTTLPQRTAMLKAITADYCGDGTAWTADGTELQWMDANERFPTPKLDLNLPGTKTMIEAVWGPKGALCLNTPRRLPRSGPPPTTGTCTGPAVTRKEVEEACGTGSDVPVGTTRQRSRDDTRHSPLRILRGSPPGPRPGCPAAPCMWSP